MKRYYLHLIYFILYLPIVVLVVFSFNNSRYSLLWHGFTWHWYQQLFHNATLATVALHSIEIGLLAASFATLLGAIGSIALFRYRFWGRRSLNSIVLMLIIIPDLLLGIALLMFYRITHFPLGFFSLLIAHITFCLPFATVVISSRLTHFDANIIEASKDLGASEKTLYQRILLPLLFPALVAAWMLSFTLSFDDVIISYFVSGPNFQILPLQIFSMVKVGVSPEINALCTIILLITFSLAIAAHFFQKRAE